MAEQFSNGYALLIAVNENSVAKWALPDVVKDVAALEEILIHPERCAYPPQNVKVITGEEASRGNILDQLEWLEERIKADATGNATAVVYYTGHGWRDTSVEPDEFYFIPYDVREDKIRSRALRARDFADAIAALEPKRLLVVLDCCHAGGMGVKQVVPAPAGYAPSAFKSAELMAGEEIVAEPGAKGLKQLAEGRGRAVFSSSTGEQSSYMRPDGKMSIFTYHLIEALTGHAQPQEGATDVLVSDVMSYVHRHVPKSADEAWGRDQDPDLKTSGIFPVALLLGGREWSKDLEAPDPLARLPQSGEEGAAPRIDTGGGAYIGGDVLLKDGDFVGRDKIIHGDEVRGGKVDGDKIAVSGIRGDNVAIAAGRGAEATAAKGLNGPQIAARFRPIYDAIEARPGTSSEDRADILAEVEEIQSWVSRGDDADESFLSRRLRNLKRMAPDILELVLATMANPAAGLGVVAIKLANRMQAETG
jgi:hypothetical protein